MTMDEIADVEQITERVVRIPLPLPLPELQSVNCYAIVGDRGIALIDPGWASPETELALTTALAGLGAQTRDVTKTVVTHHHWDHVTQASAWQRDLGIPLLLGREEHHSLDMFALTRDPYLVQANSLRRAGASEIADALKDLPPQPYDADVYLTEADRWLEDGDEIDCGGHSIVALHTPGHTRGHMVFHDPEDNLFFTGDHILPTITPAVALETDPESLPLVSYLRSLQLLADRADGRMLPAHGAVTASTALRAAELVAHHHDRLDQVAALVSEGSSTAAQVAHQMRWTRRDRALGELSPVNGMSAVNEVVQHLDVLVEQGRLVKDDSVDVVQYAPA
jgi:glyoxylase-like metal-dependent hydrolase (beta-lactamase superfamily II)